GAIEFEFEGSVQAADFTIEAIDVSIFDWGDLPENSANCSGSTYATTQACQGPRHVVNGTGTLYLGAVVDPSTVEAGEFDGQPTANATGDDANSQDDEDGVVVLQASGAIPPRTWDNGANGGRLEVTVVGDGHLVCWVDFNGNGFETTEAVFNQDVTAGVYDFEFTVPAGTFPPTGTVELYARCRLFPTGEVPVALWPAAWDGRDSLGLFAGTNNRAPGQSKNGEVEDYRWQFSDGALGVALAGLEAQTQSDHVLVSWETVSEVDNLGFNLYRNTSPDGPAEQLNENLIPSQSPGSTQGASYQWQDLDVEAGQTYYYWLEDVDVNGATSMHGPVSVDFQAPTAVSLSRFQAGQTNAPLPGSVPMALLPAATGLALAGAYLLRRRKP
ncbi:MAG: GEVED domain-containing protein, partial [Anaerolineae bacterium]